MISASLPTADVLRFDFSPKRCSRGAKYEKRRGEAGLDALDAVEGRDHAAVHKR